MKSKQQKELPYRFTCPIPVENLGPAKYTEEELLLIKEEVKRAKIKEERNRKEKKQNNN